MDTLENMLFNIDIPTGQPRRGSLLIAEPFLKEEYFNHAVICLAEYDEKSTAMGIVMNHIIPFTLQKAILGITRPDDIPLYCGGPMSRDRLYFIHTLGPLIPGATEVSPGLYLAGDFDAMKEYVNSGAPIEGCIRFFVGYSGWAAGQLQGEIKDNVWAVSEFKNRRNLLKGSGDSYWHRYVRMMGEDYKGWLYHPRNIHDN